MAKTVSDFSELVTTIYDAALEPSRWPSVLHRVGSAVGATAGTLWHHDTSANLSSLGDAKGNLNVFFGFDQGTMASYAAHYGKVNVWMKEAAQCAAGSVTKSADLYPEKLLHKTEFYQDWLRPQDLYHGVGLVISRQGSKSFRATLMRSERADHYGSEELHWLAQLLPHLQTASTMQRSLARLESLAATAWSVVDAVKFGILLLNERHEVIHANNAANSIISRTGALQLERGGSLRANTTQATIKLHRFLREAETVSETGGAGTLNVPARAGGSLTLFVAPLNKDSFSAICPQALSAIFFNDPQAAPIPLARRLREIYGMSPAEALLTEALVNGETLQEFSIKRRTSMNTVRTQFRSAATRLGVSRHIDLVRVVLTGPALLL